MPSSRRRRPSCSAGCRVTRKQDSIAIDDGDHAATLKRLLDANGQSFDIAQRLILEEKSLAPTVGAIIERHIGLLTNISIGTESKYRTYVRLYLQERLGDRPVDGIEYDDVVAPGSSGCRRRGSRRRPSPTCTGCCPPPCQRPSGCSFALTIPARASFSRRLVTSSSR